MTAAAAIAPGFADPAADAQAAFRGVLDALSRPGSRRRLPSAPAIGGLEPSAAALALTLVDADVSVWLSAGLRDEAAGWLRFHCGCPIVDGAAPQADFAFVARGDARPSLGGCLLDDPKYPDRATTLVLACEALEGGPALRLQGPGIKTQTDFAPRGLDPALWAERAALRPRYPLGVDIIVTAGDAIVGLPRTTRVAWEN